ncbi:MAG: DUF2784 domain-containing protein [Rhodoferax sp.]|nr:DUF2784 domain-containing protein [Rhodoferax sp.]
MGSAIEPTAADGSIYRLLADAVLLLHLGVVVFVVAGLLLVLAGNWCGWNWVNRLWFRLLHLAAIAVVAAQAWFGVICPLTTLEMWLRHKGDSLTYQGGFVEHWMQRLLYYEAPTWVFTLAYTLFGLLVLLVWFYFPPTRAAKKGRPD